MSDPAEYELLLPFDTDDEAFARGFEIGRLWSVLAHDPHTELEALAHASNAEMLLRLAERHGRRLTTVDLDEHWLSATFATTNQLQSDS
jgi:hypothetical protein